MADLEGLIIELKTGQTNLERLIVDVKESLEREMRSGFSEVRDDVRATHTRFDAQALRLDRQAALIQTGSRWTARMNEWSEGIDSALSERDREVAELREQIRVINERIARLEHKQNGA